MLNKAICKNCITRNRTVLVGVNGDRRVQKTPWTQADENLWDKGTVVCYNNDSTALDRIPYWCPNDDAHRALAKGVPNTLDAAEEEKPEPGMRVRRAKRVSQQRENKAVTTPADSVDGAQLPDIDVVQSARVSHVEEEPSKSRRKLGKAQELGDDEALRDSIAEL